MFRISALAIATAAVICAVGSDAQASGGRSNGGGSSVSGHGGIQGPAGGGRHVGMPGNVGFPGGRPTVVGPVGPIGPKPPGGAIGPVVGWPGGKPPVADPCFRGCGGPSGWPPGGGPKPVPPMHPPHHGGHGGKVFVGGYQPAALFVPANQECFHERRRINGVIRVAKVCHETN